MKYEYIGVGGIFFGVGVTIALAVPPPWWSKMPPTLTQSTVIFGFAFAAIGLAVMILGAWPAMPEPRAPISLTAMGVLLIALGGSWWAFAPNVGFRTFSPAHGPLIVSHDTDQPASEGPRIEDDKLTLHDLFANDVETGSVAFFEALNVKLYPMGQDAISASIEIGIFSDFVSKSQFMSFYLPGNPNYMFILKWFATGYKDYIHDANTNFRVWGDSPSGETQPTNNDLSFTKTIYIYHENILSDAEKFDAESTYRSLGLNPVFRGFNYLQYRRKFGPGVKTKISKPLPTSADLIFPAFSPDPTSQLDPSILTLFMTGFKGDGKGIRVFQGRDIDFGVSKESHPYRCRVFPLIYFDQTNSKENVALYVPPLSVAPQVVIFTATAIRQWIDEIKTHLEQQEKEATWLQQTKFDNNIFIYSETSIDDAGLTAVKDAFAKEGLSAIVRSTEYQAQILQEIAANKFAKPPNYVMKGGVPVRANGVDPGPTNSQSPPHPIPAPPQQPEKK